MYVYIYYSIKAFDYCTQHKKSFIIHKDMVREREIIMQGTTAYGQMQIEGGGGYMYMYTLGKKCQIGTPPSRIWNPRREGFPK